MADTKKFRLDARFRVVRNGVDVVKELLDTGLLDFTDALWNEIQLDHDAGTWVQIEFNAGMTEFEHLLVVADQNIEISTNLSGVGKFYGKIFLISGDSSSNTDELQVRNASGVTANIRYALVD